MRLSKLHPLRLTDKDFTKLKQYSINSGLSRSAYLRKLINQQEIKPKPPDNYKDIAWEISKIGTNINHIAHNANAAGQVSRDDVETAVFLLKKIIRLMREPR